MPTDQTDPAPLEARELSEEQVREGVAKLALGKPFERDFSKIKTGVIVKTGDDDLSKTIEAVRTECLKLDRIYMGAADEYERAYAAELSKYQLPSGEVWDNATREKMKIRGEEAAERCAKGTKAKFIQDRAGLEELSNHDLDAYQAELESLYHAAPSAEALLVFEVSVNPDLYKRFCEASAAVRELEHASLISALAAAFASNNAPLAAAIQSRLGSFPKSKITPKDVAERFTGPKHRKLCAALDEIKSLRQSTAEIRRKLVDGQDVSSLKKISAGLKKQIEGQR